MQLTPEQIKEGWKLNEGFNPIKDGQEFSLMFSDGGISHNNCSSESWDWSATFTIFAYRIIEPNTETPTIEQVNEYFKDALVVEDLQGDILRMDKLDDRGIHFFDDLFWGNDYSNKILWSPEHGYAKIIKYKTDPKREIGVMPFNEWANKTTLDSAESPNQVQALQSIIRDKNEEITALKTEIYFLKNKK